MQAPLRTLFRRADGRPLVAGELTVSSSHAAELTMAVAGRGALGCDVERACARTPRSGGSCSAWGATGWLA